MPRSAKSLLERKQDETTRYWDTAKRRQYEVDKLNVLGTDRLCSCSKIIEGDGWFCSDECLNAVQWSFASALEAKYRSLGIDISAYQPKMKRRVLKK